MYNKNIIAIDIYLERRKSREYVGQLNRMDGEYVFTYQDSYLYKDNSIPLGPDFPLSQKIFKSKKIFASFEDRLPSRKNPAYSEYCKMVGIRDDESDLFVLLSTLGHKGPSSFIFAPVYAATFGRQDIIDYRQKLRLSVREFSDLFDFSYSTISKIEGGKIHSKEVFIRVEIYCIFPEVALYEMEKNSYKVNDKVVEYSKNVLSNMLHK